MSLSQAAQSPERERLTWKQICERYPDENVVLVEVDWIDHDSFVFRDAVVLGHAPRLKEAFADARAEERGYKGCGVYFTGPIRGYYRNGMTRR